MKMDGDHLLFVLIFGGGSLGGLAALLRGNHALTKRNVFSAMLNSGMMALVIALVWWSNYKDTNLFFLVGISILAGLGGATTLDFVTLYIRKRLGIEQLKATDDDKKN
jgi:hypothetical protein